MKCDQCHGLGYDPKKPWNKCAGCCGKGELDLARLTYLLDVWWPEKQSRYAPGTATKGTIDKWKQRVKMYEEERSRLQRAAGSN